MEWKSAHADEETNDHERKEYLCDVQSLYLCYMRSNSGFNILSEGIVKEVWLLKRKQKQKDTRAEEIMLINLPENLIEKAIAELKSSEIPVFIMGGGQTADKVMRFLADRGIRIDGILINRRFWNQALASESNCSIYILEDYLSSNCCNLIVAFSGYQEGILNEYMDNIRKLYVLDFIGVLCLDGIFDMISHEFYRKHEADWRWLEAHLEDGKSQDALEAFLMQRLSGVYAKEEYEADQYFPDNLIELQEDEVFVDCGAFCGENSIDFMKRLKSHQINHYKRIICVEADEKNVVELNKNLEPYDNIEIISAGTWNRTETLHMNAGLGVGSRITKDGKVSVKAMAIDDLLHGERATYIKMDVEGSELKSLQGAANTIIKYKPKLAVCVYHKPGDLIEIPRYIYSLRNDYKFYIRNHSPYGIETVLYAL